MKEVQSEFVEWANVVDEDKKDPFDSAYNEGLIEGRLEGGEKLIEILETFLTRKPQSNHAEILEFLRVQTES